MGDKFAGKKNLNQVEINAQWEEAVKKENRGRILNENFDFNPKNLLVITDRPTSQNKLSGEEKEENKESMQELKKKLEVLTTIPKKKYPYPMTANQEIGWDVDTMFNEHRPKYAFNKMHFAETKYANDYVTMTRRSPFAAAKTVIQEKK